MCQHETEFCGTSNATGDPLLVTGAVRESADALQAEGRASPSPSMRWQNGTDSPKQQMKLLNMINRYVNGHVRQMTDLRAFGVEEYWRRSGTGPGAVGDCEDIAIEKRYQLIAAGLPADRLRFAVVYRPDVGLHTVLIAHLDVGDMVLDSRTPWVDSWQRAPYQWIAIQSASNPMQWQQPAAEEQAA